MALADAIPLDVSPDLKKPLDLKPANSNLASALSGQIEQKLPGAMQREDQAAAAKQAAAGDTVKELEHDKERRANLQAPVPPPPPSRAPEAPHTDPAAAWGSLAMAVAMIGSAFTRQPMVNALNSAAGVMNAFRKGDLDSYKIASDRWKAETDYGIKLYEYQRDAYKDAIDSIASDEKGSLAKLKVLSAALNDEPVKRLAEAGNISAISQTFQMRDDAHSKFLDETARLHAADAIGQKVLAAREALKANPNDPAAKQALVEATEDMKALQVAQGKTQPVADQRLTQENELFDRLKQDWAADPKNAGKTLTASGEAELRAQAHGSVSGRGQGQMQSTLSEDTQSRLADQFLAGQANVLSGLGYGNAGAANRAAVQNKISEHAKAMAEEMGIPENRIGEYLAIKSAEFAGITAGERTLGIRQTQLGLAAQEASLLMPAVLKASEDVPRTELTDLNKLILAGETHTGDPNAVKLGVAINSLVNVYARAISPTGVATVSDKDHARELLAAYWSNGQVKAAIDQMKIELDAATAAPAAVRQEYREGAGSRATSTGGKQPAPAAALPPDLPSPEGHAEGSTAKDASGKVVGIIRNGKWVAP